LSGQWGASIAYDTASGWQLKDPKKLTQKLESANFDQAFDKENHLSVLMHCHWTAYQQGRH